MNKADNLTEINDPSRKYFCLVINIMFLKLWDQSDPFCSEWYMMRTGEFQMLGTILKSLSYLFMS